MKSTHRSLLALACLAVSALACTAVRAVGEAVHSAYLSVKDFTHTFALRVLDIVAPQEADGKDPVVVQVRARAFVQRLVKRERPEISNTWRMCPST